MLLCESEEGYHNLCRLSTLGYTEGFHYKPRIDEELLRKYKAGLIATSSCLAGELPQFLMVGDVDGAEHALLKYVEIFGRDNFVVELMDHGMPEQRQVNPLLQELAAKHELMTIATNDCHYLNKSDAEAHEALLCIQTNTTLDDENRFRFPTTEVYFKSPDEMRDLFRAYPDAVANTEKVAARCNVELPLGKHLIPQFVPPEGVDKARYLHELVMEGLKERYGPSPDTKYIERAEFELGVIEQMGFIDYFLVTWDLIDHARKENIPVGPGRGSGAGSLVAYALKITNIDPIRFNLLFERFLNPERISMPDFDIDFCYVKREHMIDYCKKKYGPNNVAQIITFGRMLAKNVVRNVGRVMGMPYGDVDRIAKLIPDELKITLDSAYKKEPQLKSLVDSDPRIGKLWQLAQRLEGTIGNCGTHAAGVVICDQPLTDHVALYQAAGTDTVATQTEMKCVEEVGLLKMDFLGLRTLTVVHEAVRFLKENCGIDIDIDSVDTNDKNTYALLRSGKTTGIFQLESSGMRDLAKRIGLERLEEICALVALYRPGPMQFIDQYIESKFHPEKIVYEHPLLEPILGETYGIAVYQEQVMQIVQAMAGFSLGQADILRRAMGKKKAGLMAEQREKFVDGCKQNSIGEELAKTLFDKIETFAGYGFNKSHSMAYAFVAYQTAYLKANYPVEFMAALLTSESGNLDKVGLYVEECRRMGIEVLPPDVNASDVVFTVEGKSIRFGMSAIKNCGASAVRAIAEERNSGVFKDIYDFCSRLTSKQVGRKLIESLNKTGAFASTGWNRRQVEVVLDQALQQAQADQRDRDAGQETLFGMEESELRVPPDVADWPEHELLAFEKEMMGLYVSSHPLAKHADRLDRYTTLPIEGLSEFPDGHKGTIGGLVTQVKRHITAKGKAMAFLTLETLGGSCEVTVFTGLYEAKAGLLVEDMAVMIEAKVNYRNDSPGLVAEDIISIDETESRFTKAVHIRLATAGLDEPYLEGLARLLDTHQGPCDVFLHCRTPEFDEITIHATPNLRVAATAKLKDVVEDYVGVDTLWFSAGVGLPSHSQAATRA